MPRKLELTFQQGSGGRLGRWRKKYLGKVHYLGSGTSRSDIRSYKAALTAWKSLKQQLDAEEDVAEKPFDKDYETVIREWELVLAWAIQNNDDGEAVAARTKLSDLRTRKSKKQQSPVSHDDRFWARFRENPSVLKSIADMALEGAKKNTPADWESFRVGMERAASRMFPIKPIAGESAELPLQVPENVKDEIKWRDRIDTQQQSQNSVEDGSLQTWVDAYSAKRRERVAAGELSAGRYQSHHTSINFFRDWMGGESPVKSISGRTLSRFHSYLLEQVASDHCAAGYARDRLTAVRTFLRWLWGQDAIESLPKNIDSNELRITQLATTPQVFSIDEVGKLLKISSGRPRLYVLLALNTGMTQKDMSDLRDDEVDWSTQRLIRKRSKTQKHRGVPTVNYKLWPETFELLQRFRSGETRVLLNIHGAPLVKEWLDTNGKYRKNDAIRNAYFRLISQLDFNKPLKLLRKTSPSLMEGEERFRSLGELFLGETPKRVAGKFYIQETETVLDGAIDFLRETYKIASITSAGDGSADS